MNRMLLVICSISAVTGLFAAQLQNAAQTSLGATGTFSGVPNNKDWRVSVRRAYGRRNHAYPPFGSLRH